MLQKSAWFSPVLSWLIVGVVASSTSGVWAQVPKKGVEVIPGKVSAVERDKTGKNFVLKIEDAADGEIIEFTLLPRTPVIVTVEGDQGFLQQGVMVTAKTTQSMNNYFASEFTIYAGFAPPATARQDPKQPSQVELTGKVAKIDQDGIWIAAGGQPRKIQYDSPDDLVFMVKLNDIELAKAGDDVEVEGKKSSVKMTFVPSLITITSKEKISATAYYAELQERKKSKTAKAKAAKTKGGEGDVDAADPFGVKKKPADKDGDKKADDKEKSADAAEKADGDKPGAKKESGDN